MKDKTYFAVICLCDGQNEFTNFDKSGNPILFSTRKDAWKNVADTKISTLQAFIDGIVDTDEDEDDEYRALFELEYDVTEVEMNGSTIVSIGDGEDIEFTAAEGTEFRIVDTGQDRKYLYADLTAKVRDASSRRVITHIELEKMWANHWDEKAYDGTTRTAFFQEAKILDIYDDGVYRLTRTA